MVYDFSDRLLNTYRGICERLDDMTASIDGHSNSKSEYRIIPCCKKGTYSALNIVDFSNLDEMLVVLCPNTIAIKQYSKGHIPVCELTISRKDGVQRVKIKYPDETGLEQESVLDPKTQVYTFENSTINLLAKDLLGKENCQDYLLEEDTPLGVIFEKNPEGSLPLMGMKRSQKLNNLFDIFSIGEDFHESTMRISEYLSQNHMQFLQAYTSTLSFVGPNELFRSVYKFKKAFAVMKKNLERQQGIYPDNAIPDGR